MSRKKCLLLVGSPRGLKSTSYKIGNYLLNKISNKGFNIEKKLLIKINKDNIFEKNLIENVRKSDLIILSCPLYVDSIPAVTIKAMELIAEEYQETGSEKEQNMMAIVNSGFPEPEQSDTAVQICRKFAHEVNFDWLGGIKVGGGSAVGNQKLDGNKGMLKDFIKGLDLAAESATAGVKLSEDMLKIFNKSLAPKWIYRIMNFAWWFQARKHNAHKNLYDKPYQE